MPSPSLEELPAPPAGAQGWPWTLPTPLPEAGPGPWPLVSIVTPSYCQGRYLEATIRSVLLQGYPNLEYLVLDGGSTDESVAILKKYEPWLTYWASQPDAGQADAINRGWERSTGEVLGWLNSDDLLMPGSLRAAVDALWRRPELSAVYGDVVHIDAAGAPIGVEAYADWDLVRLVRRVGWISQPGSLFRRSALDAAGPLDVDLCFLMDLDLWLRLGLVAPLGYLRGIPLAQFRVHGGAKSSAQRGLAAAEIVPVVQRFFARDLPAPLRAVEREALASAHLYAARAWSAAGQPRRALRAICCAVATRPRSLLGTGPAVALAHIVLSAVLGVSGASALRGLRQRLILRSPGTGGSR